jgi:hypothetical protein
MEFLRTTGDACLVSFVGEAFAVSLPCTSAARSRCIGNVVRRPRQGNGQRRQASRGNLLAGAAHVVIPIHERTLGVVAPRPNVQLEERR